MAAGAGGPAIIASSLSVGAARGRGVCGLRPEPGAAARRIRDRRPTKRGLGRVRGDGGGEGVDAGCGGEGWAVGWVTPLFGFPSCRGFLGAARREDRSFHLTEARFLP